jgi:hypothetical protein
MESICKPEIDGWCNEGENMRAKSPQISSKPQPKSIRRAYTKYNILMFLLAQFRLRATQTVARLLSASYFFGLDQSPNLLEPGEKSSLWHQQLPGFLFSKKL